MAAPWGRALVPPQPFFDLAKVAKVDNDPVMVRWIFGATVSGSPSSLKALTSYLNRRAAEQLARQVPFYVPMLEQLQVDTGRRGPILIGAVKGTRHPFILPLDVLAQHTVIYGATGVGKTVLLFLLIGQAAEHVPVWIIDRAKGDYRALARVMPSLVVINGHRDLAWNPLEVPAHLTPQQAIAVFVAVFSKSFSLMIGSQSLLQQGLHELYERLGIFDGCAAYPTIGELREHIASKGLRGHYRAMQYQDTVINRLDGMLLEAPKTYGYRKGFPIDDLGKRSLVFELGDLNEHHARFLSTHMLSTLFHQRMREGSRGARLQTLVVVDEAGWLAPPADNVEAIGWSPLSDVLRMGREAGIGLIMASQTANLDDALLENTRTKISFRLGNGKDIERIRAALGLDRDQTTYLSRMGIGECVVGIPQMRPFLITVPEMRP
ncbi:MAG: ATP-binding protein [Rhodospirillaceae bacterium]|nr:ATP-binding protein [Rhodospirillaceae bacterium]